MRDGRTVKIGFWSVHVEALAGETFKTLGDVHITTFTPKEEMESGPTHFPKDELFILNGWTNTESRLDLVTVTHVSGVKYIMFAEELLAEGKFERVVANSPQNLQVWQVFGVE